MNVMWAVTRGSYSDYRVLCLCVEKSEAESIAERMNLDRSGWRELAEVEPFPVLRGDVLPSVELSVYAKVQGGAISEAPTERSEEHWPVAGEGTPPSCAASVQQLGNGRVYVQVRGTDHERVRKVFSERLAQALCESTY